MIEITNLIKTYTGKDKPAVDNISLTINDGEIFGFLGPNGAGKSTTIKCMTGILNYESGSIKICGVDNKEDPVGAKRKIGFVPDESMLYEGLTGRQYVNFVADMFGVPLETRKERTEKYAQVLGMTASLSDKISTYSHGMKQKISVISALVHDPEVFILDEPMTGLDPASTHELKQIMRDLAAQGRTIFFSSHILEVVEKLCTRVAIINGGKLVTVCDMRELKERRSDISLEELFLSLTDKEARE